MFKCKHCGKEFDTKQKLGGHIIWCKENPNRNGKSGFKKHEDVPEEDKGKHIIMRTCDKHGYTEFVLRKDGIYRCKKCSSESVQKRRKEIKEALVKYKGGKCEKCGYDKCIAALEFHHINPEEKEFGISAAGVTRSMSVLQKEADKCVLLCSNCHREFHWKLDNGIVLDVETFLKK